MGCDVKIYVLKEKLSDGSYVFNLAMKIENDEIQAVSKKDAQLCAEMIHRAIVEHTNNSVTIEYTY